MRPSALVPLGFDPRCPDTIRKYVIKPKRGTEKSQNWLAFLRNHAEVSWGMDFFTVPYHIARPHHGLDGEIPFPIDKLEPVTEPSRLVSLPVAGSLHHCYLGASG
jgi:hypothetical protein